MPMGIPDRRVIVKGTKPIGALVMGPHGIEAVAFAGAAESEVEYMMDVVEPIFARSPADALAKPKRPKLSVVSI